MSRLAMVSGVALLVAGVAGCGSAPAATPRTAPLDTASATASVAAPVAPTPTGTPAPLTGLPVSATVARRPTLAVDVSSTPAPRGLDTADIVFEEISSPVRFIALYQSRDAASVGPIAEARPVDSQLLAGGTPAVAYSGGPKGSVTQLQKAGVVDVGYQAQPSAYQADGGSVYASTAALFGLARGALPAGPQLTFSLAGEPLASKGATPAAALTLTLPGGAVQRWAYAPATKSWRRADLGVRVTNLILQEVPYRQLELQHGQGVFVPSAKVIGTGRSTVLSGAAVVRGTWIRKGAKQLTNFLDPGSAPVRLAPGASWVVLVPPGSTVAVR